MESQNPEEFQNSEIKKSEKPIEEIEKPKALSKIKKILTKKTLTSIVLSGKDLKKYLKNKTAIAVISIAGIGTVLSFTLYKNSQFKKEYNILSQQYIQLTQDNEQLNQEYKQARQESLKTLEQLTQDYNLALKGQEQLKQKNQELANENKQAKQQYEQLNQQFIELNKKSSQIEEEHKKTLQEANTLAEAYHILIKENAQLKKQLEEKILEKENAQLKKQLEEKILEKITVEPYKELSYSSGYGFPYYTEGLLDKQFNWQSSDKLENKGWQVINRKSPPDALVPTSNNVLCFKPSSFSTFSPEDNYATFHLQSDKLIKTFSLGGEYNISKNGFLEIYVSGDNKEWVKLQYFDSKDKDNYRGGWSTSYYANVNPVRGRLTLVSYPYIKLDKDIFIRHSSGAKSNKDYEVEIWSFSASLTSYKNYKEKASSIHSLSEQITFLEEMKKTDKN